MPFPGHDAILIRLKTYWEEFLFLLLTALGHSYGWWRERDTCLWLTGGETRPGDWTGWRGFLISMWLTGMPLVPVLALMLNLGCCYMRSWEHTASTSLLEFLLCGLVHGTAVGELHDGVMKAGSDGAGVGTLWYFIEVPTLHTWELVKTRFLLGVPWRPNG